MLRRFLTVLAAVAFGAGVVLALPGCAAFKSDVKAVSDVCRPELMQDVTEALPYVATYISCTVTGGDCSAALHDLEALGKSDAITCANAQLHAATVKLAASTGTDAGIDH